MQYVFIPAAAATGLNQLGTKVSLFPCDLDQTRPSTFDPVNQTH